VDNGWIRYAGTTVYVWTHDHVGRSFRGVRVPRLNMLMRFAKLDADGTYSPAPNQQLAYAAG
jgi:hypothetical protein